jgi:hypothetical protein
MGQMLIASTACDECRKRKVKCDAATTNNWPCSACTRVDFHCVPSSINRGDRDFASNTQACEPQELWPESRESGDDEYHQWHDSHENIPPIYTQQAPYPDPGGVFYPGPYCPSHMGYNVQTADNFISQYPHEQNVLPSPPLQQQHSSHPDSPETYEQGQYGQQIDAFREVFSADMSKQAICSQAHFSIWNPGALVNTTPSRLNVEGVDTKSDSPTVQPLGMAATGQRSPQPPMMSKIPVADQSSTPSRIFE